MVISGVLSLDNCESSNNDVGVESGNSGTATVSNSLVTNNVSYGFRQTLNGVFNSLGNNTVRHNGINTIGTINIVSGT